MQQRPSYCVFLPLSEPGNILSILGVSFALAAQAMAGPSLRFNSHFHAGM